MQKIKKPCSFQIIKHTAVLTICLILLSGCENFLEADRPTDQIPEDNIFQDEKTATATVTTLYAKLRDNVLLTGTSEGLGALMGMYADELIYYGMPGQPLETFYNHEINASNVMVSRLWNSSYNLIYLSNSAIEGLQTSTSLTGEVRDQLLGEALFIRTLTHFYLVNLFGDIPYIINNHYETNKKVSRMQANVVYQNLITDLVLAKNLIGEDYITRERTRVNKYAVSALLSRLYLYTSQWEKAENESSSIIDNEAIFKLETNLENEFLKTSKSVILQLKTRAESQVTTEANTLIFTSGPPPFISLNPSLVVNMEPNDLRRLHWVGIVTMGSDTWYYPKKYGQEIDAQYSIAFRLAEQYLIRAEARLHRNKLSDTQKDIDNIRLRAGLPKTEASSPDDLLKAILKERQFELFTEHGHRWFDLRRLKIADEILSPIKPGWQDTDIFFPIPESEILMNQNLNPQNPGY